LPCPATPRPIHSGKHLGFNPDDAFDEATRDDVTNPVAGGVIGAVPGLTAERRPAKELNYSRSAPMVKDGLANVANNRTFGGYAPRLWNGTINPFVDTADCGRATAPGVFGFRARTTITDHPPSRPSPLSPAPGPPVP